MVDSASVDARVAEVASAAGAAVVRCERPGLGRARNVGLGLVGEDVVAFTDDDCLVDPGWIEALGRAFAHLSAPAFVTGRVRADAESARRAWVEVSVTADTEPRVLGAGDDPRYFGHGANMAWRRRALEDIGGFDDLFGVGSRLRAAEDVDAWWRAVEGGATGYYAPEAVVVHRQWRSRAAAVRSFHGYGIGAGALSVKRYRLRSKGSGGSARALGRRLLVDEGVAPVWKALRSGYQMGAVADAAMFAGGLRGAWRAWRLPLAGSRFVDSG